MAVQSAKELEPVLSRSRRRGSLSDNQKQRIPRNPSLVTSALVGMDFSNRLLCAEVGKMLGSMINNPDAFLIPHNH